MLFSSAAFIYAFLPIALLCYYLAPRRFRNGVLLFFSLLFYFYGEPKYTVLLVISSLSDYAHSLYIEKHRGRGRAKFALISSIAVNLLMLGVFKYADFFVETLNGLLNTAIPLPRLNLPIGISFFTFQTMSYTIDVYRGRTHAQKNLLTLATYVCLFPQLVAGPIVRYTDVATELEGREHNFAGFATGVRRFVIGLAKKMLIANTLGELSALLLSGREASALGMWMGTIAFTLQIYFDFSGYSDMAIGLGALFGFSFPENFRYPFISKSLSEFWRRWHITLGSWFRDYVYFPMGGSRVKPMRWAWNLIVVWALTGLWHGADWNFVFWGLFFALTLTLEKLFYAKALEKAPSAISRFYTLFLVLISFAIFNADAPIGFANVLKGMFFISGLPVTTNETLYHIRSYAVPLLLGIIGSTPLVSVLFTGASERFPRAIGVGETLGIAALLLVCSAYLADGSFNPFLYFRF